MKPDPNFPKPVTDVFCEACRTTFKSDHRHDCQAQPARLLEAIRDLSRRIDVLERERTPNWED